MEEIWKDIKNYEGYYQISNYGNVRSLDRIDELGRLIKGREKVKQKQHYNKDNCYLNIILYKNGQKQRFYIHRLVAEAFIPNPDNKPQVNHISGIKTKNIVSNLEWCTRSENIKHSFKLGLSHSNFKTKSGDKHHFYGKHHKEDAKRKMKISHYKKVFQFDKNNNFIKEWNGIKEVEKILKISNGNISECCRGNRKTAGGYIWRYEQ